MSSSYGSEHNCGSRQLWRRPRWSMPQEMLEQSDFPSKIITGCSETREYKSSSFTSHVIHLVCVFLHLTRCFHVFALLPKYQWENRCEGFMETEWRLFPGKTWQMQIQTQHSFTATDVTGDIKCSWNVSIQTHVKLCEGAAFILFFLSKQWNGS